MSNVTIQKRGKYYQYKFEIAKVDGKRKFLSKSGFKTKTEAEKEGIIAYNDYINTGHDFEPSDMSHSDLLDYWIQNLKNGTEIRDVADILGHKYIETTEKFYISSTDENKKDVSNLFDSLMSYKTINNIIKYEIAY